MVISDITKSIYISQLPTFQRNRQGICIHIHTYIYEESKVKPFYEPYVTTLLQQYATAHEECPLLNKCANLSGVDCTNRQFTECLFFKDLLENQTIMLRRRQNENMEETNPHHYLIEWRHIQSGSKWYPINGQKIFPKNRDIQSRRQFANIINQVLAGGTAYYFGEYVHICEAPKLEDIEQKVHDFLNTSNHPATMHTVLDFLNSLDHPATTNEVRDEFNFPLRAPARRIFKKLAALGYGENRKVGNKYFFFVKGKKYSPKVEPSRNA